MTRGPKTAAATLRLPFDGGRFNRGHFNGAARGVLVGRAHWIVLNVSRETVDHFARVITV